MLPPRSTGSRKSYVNVLLAETAMTDEQQRPGVRRLWQSQEEEHTCMSLSEIRSGAAKMNRIVLTYAFAAGLAFLIFGGFCGVLLYLRASIADTRTREGL